MKHNVLVTGAHRSGTTFLGKMLSIPYDTAVVTEPFNYDSGVEGIEHWYLYINNNDSMHHSSSLIYDIVNGKAKFKIPKNNNDGMLKKMIRRVVHSNNHLSYLTAHNLPWIKYKIYKDPIASFASEYLHTNYNFDVIVLIRHPAAFCGSLKRLGWGFDFDVFRQQEELCIKHDLFPLLERESKLVDPVERNALIWCIVNKVLIDYLSNNESMIGMRHEDLSRSPVAEIRGLYKKLGMKYSGHVENKIKSYTSNKNSAHPENNQTHVLRRNSAKNIKRWKSILSQQDIDKIYSITRNISDIYYSDDDW